MCWKTAQVSLIQEYHLITWSVTSLAHSHQVQVYSLCMSHRMYWYGRTPNPSILPTDPTRTPVTGSPGGSVETWMVLRIYGNGQYQKQYQFSLLKNTHWKNITSTWTTATQLDSRTAWTRRYQRQLPLTEIRLTKAGMPSGHQIHLQHGSKCVATPLVSCMSCLCPTLKLCRINTVHCHKAPLLHPAEDHADAVDHADPGKNAKGAQLQDTTGT